ncbi:LytR C-terminal domain-containing protein [Kutzneria sp. CA-103260]|uniref:LytR C-terminal domain-containing protein n=1 Tax=Kutzneria sp. CA-103260 TaxID=2802641 RepID=UPI001BAA56E1|nr:LytR C-terminal domain-containing protein [Kutzneria sp. CA-103260]QUQ69537.1 LytR cell envelope-related transcriptional attenuator [Kutzneria sp. CA-103260]
MTAPETPTGGPARPARIAGIVLLVVAGIALVMGVVSLLPLGGGSNEAGATTTTTTPSATTSSSAPAKPTTTTPAPTTTTTAPPASTTANQPTPQPPANNPQSVQVRVYNNGTIQGYAQQAADDFKAAGWNVTTVGPYSQGIIATTTVYYRPGTDEEAAANQLGHDFHMRVMPRFDGIETASPGVIVIITNDFSPPAKG